MPKPFRRIAPLVGLLGIIGIFGLLQLAEHPEERQRASLFASTQRLSGISAKSSTPLRIQIPVIGVDAPIESVGLTDDGAMAMPVDQVVVGWFKSDTMPGNTGVSVMAGHYGAGNSSFNNLHKLSVGDRIVVISNTGSVSFLVTRLQEFTSTERVPEVFISGYSGSFLNLITCSGAWDSDAGEYESRLVVFAEQEAR